MMGDLLSIDWFSTETKKKRKKNVDSVFARAVKVFRKNSGITGVSLVFCSLNDTSRGHYHDKRTTECLASYNQNTRGKKNRESINVK